MKVITNINQKPYKYNLKHYLGKSFQNRIFSQFIATDMVYVLIEHSAIEFVEECFDFPQTCGLVNKR